MSKHHLFTTVQEEVCTELEKCFVGSDDATSLFTEDEVEGGSQSPPTSSSSLQNTPDENRAEKNREGGDLSPKTCESGHSATPPQDLQGDDTLSSVEDDEKPSCDDDDELAELGLSTPSKSLLTNENASEFIDSASSADNALLHDLQSVYDELSMYRKNTTRMMTSVKRCYGKMVRRLEKEKKNNNKKLATERGNGLTKPGPVSTSLCSFMDIPSGTLVARAEATKYLHKYIAKHNLYDKANRQFIIPNSALQKLLNMSEGDRVHIFSMQKKMNCHFRAGSPKPVEATMPNNTNKTTPLRR